ncbi:hypothetical protein [Streptomyces sp. NPDC001966]
MLLLDTDNDHDIAVIRMVAQKPQVLRAEFLVVAGVQDEDVYAVVQQRTASHSQTFAALFHRVADAPCPASSYPSRLLI